MGHNMETLMGAASGDHNMGAPMGAASADRSMETLMGAASADPRWEAEKAVAGPPCMAIPMAVTHTSAQDLAGRKTHMLRCQEPAVVVLGRHR